MWILKELFQSVVELDGVLLFFLDTNFSAAEFHQKLSSRDFIFTGNQGCLPIELPSTTYLSLLPMISRVDVHLLVWR